MKDKTSEASEDITKYKSMFCPIAHDFVDHKQVITGKNIVTTCTTIGCEEKLEDIIDGSYIHDKYRHEAYEIYNIDADEQSIVQENYAKKMNLFQTIKQIFSFLFSIVFFWRK